MNRRIFLLLGFTGLISLAFRSVFGSERITDCKDCPYPLTCCEFKEGVYTLPISIWERDILIREGEKRGIDVGTFEPYDLEPDSFLWNCGSNKCPFLEDRRCLIYDKRTTKCRQYYCPPWKLTSAEQDSINKKIDREWNRGRNE